MIGALVVAEVPALPLHAAGKYVAAAYIVLFAIVLIYVAIMATRLRRVQRDLGELRELAEHGPVQLAAGAQDAAHLPAAGPEHAPGPEHTAGPEHGSERESTLA